MAAGAFLWWRRGKKGIEKAPQQQQQQAGAPDVIPRLTENPLHNPGTTVTTTAAASRKSAVPAAADLYPEEDIESSMADMDIEMKMTNNPMQMTAGRAPPPPPSPSIRDSKRKEDKKEKKEKKDPGME